MLAERKFYTSGTEGLEGDLEREYTGFPKKAERSIFITDFGIRKCSIF